MHFFNCEEKQHSLSVLNLIVWDFTFVLTHVLDRADGRREKVRGGGAGAERETGIEIYRLADRQSCWLGLLQ